MGFKTIYFYSVSNDLNNHIKQGDMELARKLAENLNESGFLNTCFLFFSTDLCAVEIARGFADRYEWDTCAQPAVRDMGTYKLFDEMVDEKVRELAKTKGAFLAILETHGPSKVRGWCQKHLIPAMYYMFDDLDGELCEKGIFLGCSPIVEMLIWALSDYNLEKAHERLKNFGNLKGVSIVISENGVSLEEAE